VWGTDTQSGNEAIRCCIKRLRKKIDNDKTPLIVTLRGEGYMMDL
jgi:DNA-binding response OmpR family regulator